MDTIIACEENYTEQHVHRYKCKFQFNLKFIFYKKTRLCRSVQQQQIGYIILDSDRKHWNSFRYLIQ